MRWWPRMLLFIALAATLAFAGKLWASALQPRSIALLPPLPLRPAAPRPHLIAPRIVVPVRPSVAAHLGLSANGGGAATSHGAAGGGQGKSSSAPSAQAS